MTKRKIINIDQKKCNGCGECIPNCPEGALQMIDNKARLVSDLFCDGLGACIGHCPQGAITIEEREAVPYNESKVMENIVKQGTNTIKAHLKHLKDHGADDFLKEAVAFLKKKGITDPMEEKEPRFKHKQKLPCGCPGTMLREIKPESNQETSKDSHSAIATNQGSQLRQWPVQLNLLPPYAPFFNNSDLLIAADCVGFANPNLHQELIKGKSIAIGCPKLDNLDEYKEKITEIIKQNDLKSITVAIMEVPCCYGLYSAVEGALKDSGKNTPLKKIVMGIDGKEKE